MLKLKLILVGLLYSGIAEATDLIVNIENITQNKAPVICGLFDSEEGFPLQRKLAKASVSAEITAKGVMCVFKDIPAKQIAISVMEDWNRNGKVDTSFVGFPKEPWGVSNNAPAHAFGPPTFAEAMIDGASTNDITITLIKP